MKYTVPDDEQDNFVSVYWQLLKELEQRIDIKHDLLDKRLVEGAYNVLNRSGITQHRPYWEK